MSVFHYFLEVLLDLFTISRIQALLFLSQCRGIHLNCQVVVYFLDPGLVSFDLLHSSLFELLKRALSVHIALFYKTLH